MCEGVREAVGQAEEEALRVLLLHPEREKVEVAQKVTLGELLRQAKEDSDAV